MLLERRLTYFYTIWQQFVFEKEDYVMKRNEVVIYFTTSSPPKSLQCPHCGSNKIYIHDKQVTYLQDFPDSLINIKR